MYMAQVSMCFSNLHMVSHCRQDIPNIIHVHGWELTPDPGIMHIVMECGSSDLAFYLRDKRYAGAAGRARSICEHGLKCAVQDFLYNHEI
jgi:hypothetical protein